MQIVAQRVEESVDQRHHSVVTALALDDEHPPISDLNVGEAQPEDLATTQPTEQNSIAATIARSRCVRSAPISRSASAGDRMVGNVRGTRTNAANRDLRVPPARRVDNPRGTGIRVTPVSPRAIA